MKFIENKSQIEAKKAAESWSRFTQNHDPDFLGPLREEWTFGFAAGYQKALNDAQILQNEPMSEYDSRPDTIEHIMRVRELLYIVQNKLEARGFAHDQSKLVEPEKYTFDTCTAKLKAMAYGSDEYKAALVDLKPALDHHYAANPHHPEHFETGVAGMSLLDVLEMLIDWKAATERMKNGGDIRKSLELNTERFKLSPQLVNILANTIKEMGW